MGNFIQKFHKYCFKLYEARIIHIKVFETYLKFVIKCFPFKIFIIPIFIILGGNLSGLTLNIVIMS